PFLVCHSMQRPPPRSILFPYTPLFRSRTAPCRQASAERPSCGTVPECAWRSAGLGRGACGAARIEAVADAADGVQQRRRKVAVEDRKSTRLNSSHVKISYAVFCLKKKI